MTNLAIRPGTAADWPAVIRLLNTVFHETGDRRDDQAWRGVFEPERALLIDDGDELVASAACFTRSLAVPGGTIPAAHVTMVGVAPTHRRQGLLTRMMVRQLAEIPEPIAVLWASEGRIYPRFGYGMATTRVSFSIDTAEVHLPPPTRAGRLRTMPVDKARPELQRVYDAVWRHRPGWSSRDDRWWTRILADPPGQRHGATEERVLVHEGDAGVDGYARWRSKGEWGETGPEGTLMVQEVVGADPQVYLALWRFLCSIDLIRTVTFWHGAPDEPLLHLADEPRRLGATMGDGLYVRIVDLPGALAARRYPTEVDLVLEVSDKLRDGNAGRWRLTAGPDHATCTRTDQPADLACDIADLGAAYLGGTSLGALGAAGRVREQRPGALAAASTAFGWHRLPAGMEIF